MIKKRVIVMPYNEEWKKAFSDIKNELDDALGDLALSIEHVGYNKIFEG